MPNSQSSIDFQYKKNIEKYNSINEFIEDKCQEFSHKIALENYGSQLSYEELNYYSSIFANFIVNKTNLIKGDRIAIQMPNLIQYLIVTFGALKAGLVVVNINPLYTPDEMLKQMNDSGCKAIIILENFAFKLEKILKNLENNQFIIISKVGDFLGTVKGFIVNNLSKYITKIIPKYNIPNFVFLKDALNTLEKQKQNFPKINKTDLAFLQYTTGTTGTPKGAMLTHGNILSNIFQVIHWIGNNLTEKGKEIGISPLPLYHIFSLITSLIHINLGSKNILITNPRDINNLIKILNKSNFSLMTGVNTLFKALLNEKKFKKINFSNCKFVLGGAATIQESVAKKWNEITNTKIIEAYGLTEASPAVSINPIIKPHYNTVGKPLTDTQIKIIDENGNFLENYQKGEIIIKGPQVMKGYWRQKDETNNIFFKNWLKTGDIGYLDDENFLRIVDRKKDIVNISGFNVYPNEIDNLVLQHLKVLEAATIGVHDEKSGEALKIFIVKKDESLTKKEILDFCKEKLTNYKIPKYIEFTKSLPKLLVGKIDKKALKKIDS